MASIKIIHNRYRHAWSRSGISCFYQGMEMPAFAKVWLIQVLNY